jgi:PIN domain nuclease of toxin-antitoxin system
LAHVLDASALLAYLRTVNLAEVLSRSADREADPAEIAAKLAQSGLLDGAITVEPFTTADVIDTARLRPLTRDAGLSLGDRACLALARRLGTPALTADTAWQGVAHDVELHSIR